MGVSLPAHGEGIPLINFLKEEGIRGCYSYWSHTLSEEAADVTIRLNEKAGWFSIVMHSCHSKGRLLKLRDEIGISPYPRYCEHCDSYRAAVEQAGLYYIYNFLGMDQASCSLLIYDPAVFDGKVFPDENTETLNIRAAQNEYYPPDFYCILNMGLDYLGEQFGREEIEAYLIRFTRNVYAPVIQAIRTKGRQAIGEKLVDLYQNEKVSDALTIQSSGNTLSVETDYCPGVKHLNQTGRRVSKWYGHSTSVVMKELAKHAKCRFTMESYDRETGAAKFRFDQQ